MSGPPPIAERIRQVEERLHVVTGLATALEDPLAVLQVIVDCDDEDAARAALRERYGFDAGQASAVVDLQLRRASARHRAAVRQERDHLTSLLTGLRQAQDQPRAVAAHYDARAATYDASGMHRALADLVAGLAGDFLDAGGLEAGGLDAGGLDAGGPDAGGLVVDVATGTALVLRAIAARRPGARLVGVDLSPGMLAVARAALPQAQLVQADASALPVADGSVDLITCVTALHLLAEPAVAFDEWARALRPGGRLVTATFAAETAHPAPPARPDLPQGFARRHDDYRTPDQMRRAFRDHPFRLEDHREHELDGDGLLVCMLRRTS